MRGSRIKYACMNVHSIQIRKFKRLEKKLNRSNNPAAVVSLQETWTSAKSSVIQDIKSAGYRIIHKPRINQQSGRGGGVAIICFDSGVNFGPINLRYKPETLEYVVTRVQTGKHSSRIINVYRPGGSKATSLFFSELEKLIKKVQYANEEVILCGDLNVALNRKSTKIGRAHV